MKKVGICLSGGGVKALIYAGVLQALEDNGINIDVVGGLSGGAIVGALYAEGFSGKQILDLAVDTNFFSLLKPSSIIQGEVVDHNAFKQMLEEHIKSNDFSKLKRKLILYCSDIDKKEQVVIKSGNIVEAIIASCALPPLIKPVRINNRKLVDGGFSTSYGASNIRQAGAEYVIGVSVEKWIDVSAIPEIMRDFVDAVGIAWSTVASYEQKYDPVDFRFIEFGDDTNMLDFGADKELIYQRGYNKAMEFMPIIKKQVSKNNFFWDFLFN